MNWKKLIAKLTFREFKGVSGSLHFSDNFEAWEAFKKEFHPKVETPEYLATSSMLYETGEITIRGMNLTLYGAHKPNPNYQPPPPRQPKPPLLNERLVQAVEKIAEKIT